MVTAWAFAVIEKAIRRAVPATPDLFLVPVTTLLIGAALAIFVIMPVSALFMKGLTWLLVDFALKPGGVVGGFIMSSLFLPMVMLGIHQGLTPLHAQLITAGHWLWYVAGWLVAVVAGAVLTYFFGYREADVERVYGGDGAVTALDMSGR